MRYVAATLASVALVAAPVLAQDHAVPRGGGSSGGGSSSSGASHHSGGSSSSGGSGSSYSGGDGGSSSSSSRSGISPAERRHPRAGTGTGHRYPYYGGGYYGGYDPWYPWYYPSSYYWGPYWGSYYYGYWPYGAYYSGGYYRSYRRSDYDSGAVRVLVDPEDAKVYVDGYYAGTVDDFDGLTQRLYVSRGPHEVLLKREGYRSQRFRIYAQPGETLKIDYDMKKGEGDDPLQDLSGGRGDDFDRRVRAHSDDESDNPSVEEDDSGPRVRVEDREAPRGTGNLRVRISPSDASVYVDGEFRGTARQTRSLDLSPGTHRIEVVRPGYATAQREVEIDRGQTHDLEVTLEQP